MPNLQRNYPLLLLSQFLSALGDNALLAVIVGQLTYLQQAGILSEAQLRTHNTVYTSLLFVPFIFLAPVAGFLNDRHSKTSWLAGGNALKIFGTLLCALSLRWGPIWQGIGYLVVGVGACVYGPAKYGILPEILPRERLVRANGMVELLTLVAILGGAIAGSVMADRWKDSVLSSYAVLVGIYLGSFLLNLLMERTPSNPGVLWSANTNAFKDHARQLALAPRLSRMLVGTGLFWICGAAMKINFQPWGLSVLHLPDNTQIALLGLWLSVGVMVGSILAGRWFPVGQLQRTRLFGFALASMLGLLFSVEHLNLWKHPTVQAGALHLILPVVGLLIGTGIAAGFFLIPLNAALQAESDPNKLGKTIAVQNLVDNLGMVSASLLCLFSVQVGISASGVFLVLAVVTAGIVALLKIPASTIPTTPAGKTR
jgi:LPLT family lysophospholipid transporter-like MFS transporter